MIRNLMASSAMLALVTAGALSVAQAQTNPSTDAAQPAPMEQPAAAPAAGAGSTDLPADSSAAAKTDLPADQTQADATLTPEQPTIATAFIGRSVFSSEAPESDNIGEVNDLIIGDDGTITHAVVGVGGFLGIGEKDVAVPFDELQVVGEGDGEIRLIYASTKEQLEAAEAFDRTAFDPQRRAAEEQQAAADAGTTPAVGVPAPAAMPAGETDAAMTTEPANTMEAAPATTEMAATAPDATVTETAAETSAAAGAGFVNFSADQVRASSMLGQQIYGANNESIGEVSDLVLQEDGQTRSALVDVGGFLGVGEKKVAIPFDEVKVGQNPDNAAEPRLTAAMTREQLDQAPAYVGSADMAATQPAGTGSAGTDPAATDPAATPAVGTDMAATDPNAPAATQTDAAATPAPATDSNVAGNTGVASAQYTPVTQDLTADNLIGSAVYGQNDDSIGEVGDVVFDPKGAIQAVVVDVGGFLGVGEKPVAVEFDALNVQKNDNGDIRLMMNATQEQLQNAPAYSDAAAAGAAQPAAVQ